MPNLPNHSKLGLALNIQTIAIILAPAFALAAFAIAPAQAQTLTVLHNFTGGADGAGPYAGLTIDAGGNLYGTAQFGGLEPCGNGGGGSGCGTVFRLAPRADGWIFTPLYQFAGGNDGAIPVGRVIFGPDGSLYGTTQRGGSQCDGYGCGTVFNMKLPPTVCKAAFCPWTERVLHAFMGFTDGAYPLGELIFDQAGNIYGTTVEGGINDGGTAFELTPSGGGWAESLLVEFENSGINPLSGLIFDQAGNLYGTTSGEAENGYGNVYQLMFTGSSWKERGLYNFQGADDGGRPAGGLIFDQSGNLYGTTAIAGSGGTGTVFELTPSNGAWTFSLLYSFVGNFDGPRGSLFMDAAGNLYGTTIGAGTYSRGSVFKLTASGGGWIYTSLHDFTGGMDGGYPIGNVIFDASGNLYGTASSGGTGSACYQGCGVAWEITP